MAHSLSTFTASHQFLTPKTTSVYKTPQFSRISQWPFTSIGHKNSRNVIKSVSTGGNNDSLDYLQRTNKQQQQEEEIKKKAPQVTPIGLWDRFPTARTVQQMIDTMERIMDDPMPYNGGGAWPSRLRSENYNRGRTPWEIKEGEGDYNMRFDMPGMSKQDVKVYVEEKMLVVKAEKKIENNGEEEWDAKSFGKYSFRIALPENIQFEMIKAEVKDGVLYIAIPKATVSSKILDINVE